MGNCAGTREGFGGGGGANANSSGGDVGGDVFGFADPMSNMDEDSPEKFGCQAGQIGDAFSTFTSAEKLSTADFITEENLYQRSSAGRTTQRRKGKR